MVIFLKLKDRNEPRLKVDQIKHFENIETKMNSNQKKIFKPIFNSKFLKFSIVWPMSIRQICTFYI